MNRLLAWAAGAFALLLVLGLASALALAWSARGENARLREELSRTVKVVEERDAALAQREGQFTRMFATFQETLSVVASAGGGRTVIRETRTVPGAAGPAGPPGRPGAGPPGAPGPPGRAGAPAPMIPAERADAARAAATERILARIRAGHLVDCPTPGVAGDVVELLREPGGRLLSPTPCVESILDETRLREPPAVRARGRWKAVAGMSVAGTFGFGVAYEAMRLPVLPVTLDAVALVQPRLHLGPGLSWRLTDVWSVGGAYLVDLQGGGGAGPWLTFSYRF